MTHQILARTLVRLTDGPLNGYSRPGRDDVVGARPGSSPQQTFRPRTKATPVARGVNGWGVTGAHMAPSESTGIRGASAHRSARRCVSAALLGYALLAGAPVNAAPTTSGPDSPACRTVRLSDIGWTDVTATTALFGALLRDLGYRPQITVLSLPVTYASMKNKDIDVFLGNWMPSQDGDRKAYVADGSVEVIGANLTGAKYTLA